MSVYIMLISLNIVYYIYGYMITTTDILYKSCTDNYKSYTV